MSQFATTACSFVASVVLPSAILALNAVAAIVGLASLNLQIFLILPESPI